LAFHQARQLRADQHPDLPHRGCRPPGGDPQRPRARTGDDEARAAGATAGGRASRAQIRRHRGPGRAGGRRRQRHLPRGLRLRQRRRVAARHVRAPLDRLRPPRQRPGHPAERAAGRRRQAGGVRRARRQGGTHRDHPGLRRRGVARGPRRPRGRRRGHRRRQVRRARGQPGPGPRRRGGRAGAGRGEAGRMSTVPPEGGNAAGGLVGFATRRRVTVAMVTLTFVVFGLIALGGLKVNLLPELSYPTLTVRTEYPGAAPSEVETLITEPAEEALGVVKGLRKLKSVSRTGQSDVVLEFAWGTDMDQASLEVPDKMETLQFPLEAAPPVLMRFNPSTQPIMRLVLSPKEAAEGDEALRRLMELRRYADEDLKKKLEPVAGVAAVKVGGGLEDEIQVDIDGQKLAQLGLSIDTVIQRLQQENINISGGRLEEGSQRYLVRTVNQFASVDEIRDMLLTTRTVQAGNDASEEVARVAAASGNAAVLAAAMGASSQSQASGNVPLRLGDVASVRQGYKEREAIIRIDGREAVEL